MAPPSAASSEIEAALAALSAAREALRRERAAHAAIEDEETIVAHAAAVAELRGALESLRLAAAQAPGLLVQRVGVPGNRDGRAYQ